MAIIINSSNMFNADGRISIQVNIIFNDQIKGAFYNFSKKNKICRTTLASVQFSYLFHCWILFLFRHWRGWFLQALMKIGSYLFSHHPKLLHGLCHGFRPFPFLGQIFIDWIHLIPVQLMDFVPILDWKQWVLFTVNVQIQNQLLEGALTINKALCFKSGFVDFFYDNLKLLEWG